MAQKPSLPDSKYHAWNPGLSSNLPTRLLPLITLFRPENSDVGYQQAKEAADFSGLAVDQLCALKVERLVAHEVLIRVTADLSVPDGPSYEYLGLQLRGMVDSIYRGYMVPEMQNIATGFDLVRQRAKRELTMLVDEICSFDALQKKPKSGFFGFFKRQSISPDITTKPPELHALDQLRQRVRDEDDFPAACMTALIIVVSLSLIHI